MSTPSTSQSPRPGTEINALEIFVGSWHAEGTSFGPDQSPVPWISDERYEWLPGGFFLLHHWDEHGGSQPFIGTQILGFDNSEGGYFSCMFDNGGHHPRYRIRRNDSIWTFDEPATRATLTFEDRDTITLAWEWKNGGSVWLPLCNRVARRVGGRI